MTDEEKTAEELEAEQAAFKKARGDEPDEKSDDVGDGDAVDASAETDEGVGDGEDGDASVGGDGESADDEGAGESDDGGGDKGITIPKAVFDKRNQKSKEKLDDANRRLAEAESKLQTQKTNTDVDALQTEIDDLDDKYEELLMEGEQTKARVVRKDMRAKQKTLTNTLLANQGQTTGTAAIDQVRFDVQLASAEVKFPKLNPDEEEFDQEVANEVGELLEAFQAQGLKAAPALIKALKYVMRESDEVKLDPAVKKQQRATKARKKVSKAKGKSPPDLTGVGQDSDKGSKDDGLPDISKMSPAQFAKLSPEDLSRARGDFLDGDEA